MAAPATVEQPSHARYGAVAFGVALAFITYIDRVAISQAAPAISRELRLTTIEMGYVFSAFGLTYALLEIPSGWLCDRIGPRKVLTRIVLWWSFFTAATGWVWNLQSLLITRLLFGAGEAGCFPGLAKSFSAWLPRSERPMAEGIKATSARWGAAFTPYLIVSLYRFFTWRETFVLFGGIGVIWAAAFYWWYRDDPAAHPGVNQAELALLADRKAELGEVTGGAPWRKFLSSRSAWALCIQWFCHYYGFYFYITWLPTYLLQARGLNLKQGALLAGLPMLSAGFGSLFCGWLAPRMAVWTGSMARTRRVLAYIAYGGASAMLLLFTSIQDPVWAMAAMSLSAFAAELSGPISWTTAMDLGGRYVGTLSAAMNMTGHFGGSVAPTLIGYILVETGYQWTIAFYCSAAIYSIGALCWMLIDPVTSLDSGQDVALRTGK
jgi:ACS family glucarate transporter-like MFS transporter